MFNKIKRGLAYSAAALLLAALALWLYARSFGLDSVPRADPRATTADLAFMQGAQPGSRGRVLAVVSSSARIGGKKGGYELTELARAYHVFRANGFEVDIASPQGGKAPANIDADDMGSADYAFLNDAQAQRKAHATLPLAEVDPGRYRAVFFVGGKGALADFPDNPDIARIVGDIGARGVVGAVCHGPAALLHLRAGDRPLVSGRRMTGFTNDEELFLIEDARSRFPFLLEERARQLGARFVAGPQFLDHTVVDGNLVTGQNPWSTWSTADAMVAALGYRPVARAATPEEQAVHLLAAYQRGGLDTARAAIGSAPQFDKMLVLMHATVALMQWRLHDAFQLQRLARGT